MRTCKVIFAVLVCTLGVVTLATAQRDLPVSPEVQKLVTGNTQFALDLYDKLAGKEGNLFLSPYSISTALAMTAGGARGNTLQEMEHVLHLPASPHPAAEGLAHDLLKPGKDRKFQLQIANRLWGQKGYGFLPDFLKLTETHYGAGLKEVDFVAATDEARQEINAWVEKETQDKIKDLLKPGILTPDTRLVLTNAIYFKAAWQRPFDVKQTQPGPFATAAGQKVQTPFMHAHMRGLIFRGQGLQVLSLPYEGNELEMLVVLPSKADGLAEVEKKLTQANLAAWRKQLTAHQVDLALPRFKVTAEFRLDDALKQLGMKDAFDRERADFSGMATRERLNMSAVVHKAFVDVNETGTEAAASTAVVIEARSLPPPATFHADHPFLFLIQDNRTGSILFLGRLTQPAE